jgi:hypothetical protein
MTKMKHVCTTIVVVHTKSPVALQKLSPNCKEEGALQNSPSLSTAVVVFWLGYTGWLFSIQLGREEETSFSLFSLMGKRRKRMGQIDIKPKLGY